MHKIDVRSGSGIDTKPRTPGSSPADGSVRSHEGRSAGLLAGLAAVAFIWSGMVLGISFLEAPVKFMAPSLTLPVALDVGRHVFGALNLVELGWMALSMALMVAAWSQLSRSGVIMLPVIWTVVAAQSLWLLPALNARASQIIAGEMPPDSYHHTIYCGLEVLKVVLLLTVGALLLKKLAAGRP